MSYIRIETNTPIPAKNNGSARAGQPRKYPWADMEVGNCVVLEDQKEYANAMQSARIYKQYNPTFDYTGRRCSDGYYRIWRTMPEAESTAQSAHRNSFSR